MPIGAAGVALIGAGVAAASTGTNAYMTGRTNKKTRQFSKEMYDRQRGDALADYTMQNEYNSPTSQMQRLREAGLNPNLVYGDGTVANNSSGVRNTETKSWTPHAPQIDLSGVGSSVMSMYDIRMKEAQTDNLKKQNTVLEQEAMLKASQIQQTNAQTQMTSANTHRSQFDLEMSAELKKNSMDIAAASLNKINADVQYTTDQNTRAGQSNDQNIMESVQRIASQKIQNSKVPGEIAEIKQRTQNLQKDAQLKQLDINLKEKGIQPSDPAYMRIITQLLNGVSIDKIIKSLSSNPATQGAAKAAAQLTMPWLNKN